jgi:hypothetical protein
MTPHRPALDLLRRLESSQRILIYVIAPALLLSGAAIGVWVGWWVRVIVSE